MVNRMCVLFALIDRPASSMDHVFAHLAPTCRPMARVCFVGLMAVTSAQVKSASSVEKGKS